jgi:hypothetical protein
LIGLHGLPTIESGIGAGENLLDTLEQGRDHTADLWADSGAGLYFRDASKTRSRWSLGGERVGTFYFFSTRWEADDARPSY